jgi:hypothetical protein
LCNNILSSSYPHRIGCSSYEFFSYYMRFLGFIENFFKKTRKYEFFIFKKWQDCKRFFDFWTKYEKTRENTRFQGKVDVILQLYENFVGFSLKSFLFTFIRVLEILYSWVWAEPSQTFCNQNYYSNSQILRQTAKILFKKRAPKLHL